MTQVLKRFIKFLLSFFKSTIKRGVKLIKNGLKYLYKNREPLKYEPTKSKPIGRISPYIEKRSHKRNFKYKKINF